MLKDDQLAALANEHNVAQFISFGPGAEPRVRHIRMRGAPISFSSVEEAVHGFLNVTKSCNIRTFKPSSARGAPFDYELTQPARIIAVLRMYALQGFYSIMNETIDINDGGVSGVSLGGILEFAPKDTPRAVEKPGIMAVEYSVGLRILETAYSFVPEIPHSSTRRIEFSIHPNRVGYRKAHTVLWQSDSVEDLNLSVRLKWPNRFSRFMGDKAFGLLVASCLGSTVPRSVVVGRNIAPFSFGRRTFTGERWIRTCPPSPVPGKFTTADKWLDPFALLQHEDPSGNLISSVISQDGVDPKFSGTSYLLPEGSYAVAGVPGRGDLFMQGRRSPQVLPDQIIADVQAAASRLHERLGPVRLEWVHDGKEPWILQLHLSDPHGIPEIFKEETASHWVRFNPDAGLDVLREMVRHAEATGEGIMVTRPVGVTSHVGEILRASGVPTRIAAEDDEIADE